MQNFSAFMLIKNKWQSWELKWILIVILLKGKTKHGFFQQYFEEIIACKCWTVENAAYNEETEITSLIWSTQEH